jgi:hypothetical protein
MGTDQLAGSKMNIANFKRPLKNIKKYFFREIFLLKNGTIVKNL